MQLRQKMAYVSQLQSLPWGFVHCGTRRKPESILQVHAKKKTTICALSVALARAAERRLGDFSVQSLANTAWAFAKVVTPGQSDSQLFAALARVAERCVVDFDVQSLSDMVWAFAMVEQSDALQLTALARVAEQRVGNFYQQELCMTLGALTLH